MKHTSRIIQIALIALSITLNATPHPLGNFTVSHFTRVATDAGELRLRYIVDYAEIAAFQELQTLDANRDGLYSKPEKDAWLARTLPQWLAGLRMTADGQPLTLRVLNQSLTLLPGAVKLFTMRIECELEASFTISAITRFTLTDSNHTDRQGWHEIVLEPVPGVTVFDSTAFGDGVTNELKAYPEDKAPLAERAAEWSVTTGTPPANAKLLRARDGQLIVQSRQRAMRWRKPLLICLALGALLLALTRWRRRIRLVVANFFAPARNE